MIGRGFTNKQIARMLGISPETVKSHVKRIFSKLAVGTRAEAVSRAGTLELL
jgi:DNA-binding NarL/FixJ family response regulator